MEIALNKIKKIFISIGLYSFFINLASLIAPIYMLAVYDIVMPSRSLDTLLMITLIVVVVFIAWGILEYVRSQVMIHAANKLENILTPKLYDITLDLAASMPTKASVQPMRDFATIKNFLGGPGVMAFFDFPWFPLYLFIMFMFDSILGWCGVGAALIIMILTLLNEKETKKGIEEANSIYQNSLRHLSHTINNIEVIEALGMRKPLFKKWIEKYKDYIVIHSKASEKASRYSNATKMFRMMSASLMYGVGAFLAINARISPGMIIAGAVLMGRALQPITLMVSSWKSFTSARSSYKKLKELLDALPEKMEYQKLPEPKGALELINVYVIPPEATKPVLKGINLKIEAGESVGIIGPSAAGKSSLARTMVGFWKPVNGEVRLDGALITHYNRDYLGDYIGYLPQDIELLEGTIAENIARFKDTDPQKIIEAAQLSGIHEMILKMPDAYDTKVGPGGFNLSGGQKQRVGIARAIFNNPKLIILDEPNSNLDEKGEQSLIYTLKAMKQRGSTVIFITHRTNILALADKVAIVDGGVIKAFASKDEIFSKAQKNK